MKRLIVLPNNIGDVIMVTPVFEALKCSNPNDELHFLVESGYEGGVLNNPYIDRIHLIPRTASAEALRSEDSFPIEAFSLGKWIDTLDALAFDQIINFSQHPLYSALVSLISAPQKEGMVLISEGIDSIQGFWSRYLLAVPYSRRCNNLHAIDIYKKIAGVENPAEPKIFLTDSEKEMARKMVIDCGWDGISKLIVFQPGAAIAAKMWSPQRWIELGNLCIQDGYTVVLTGAPSELNLCSTIASALGMSVIVVAGKTTFRESIAIVANASIVVSGDTALMHAASAVGTPLIALFGSTSPVETGPYGSGHAIFAAGSCNKQPCFLHSCDQSTNCIDEISARSVFETLSGKPASFRTEFSNTRYALVAEKDSTDRYFDSKIADTILAIITKDESVLIPDFLRSELSLLEKRLSLACLSLEHFARGDQSAYDRYATHIQSLHESEGIGSFFAALVNIGLNSISLTEMQNGVAEMLELISGYASRLREVLHG